MPHGAVWFSTQPKLYGLDELNATSTDDPRNDRQQMTLREMLTHLKSDGSVTRSFLFPADALVLSLLLLAEGLSSGSCYSRRQDALLAMMMAGALRMHDLAASWALVLESCWEELGVIPTGNQLWRIRSAHYEEPEPESDVRSDDPCVLAYAPIPAIHWTITQHIFDSCVREQIATGSQLLRHLSQTRGFRRPLQSDDKSVKERLQFIVLQGCLGCGAILDLFCPPNLAGTSTYGAVAEAQSLHTSLGHPPTVPLLKRKVSKSAMPCYVVQSSAINET